MCSLYELLVKKGEFPMGVVTHQLVDMREMKQMREKILPYLPHFPYLHKLKKTNH